MKRVSFPVLAVFIFTSLIAAAALGGALETPPSAKAQEAWVIRLFQATYEIEDNSTLRVREDIAVDFGALQRHGIFRYLPAEYEYDPATPPQDVPEYDPEADYHRVLSLGVSSVTEGGRPVPFSTFREGANLVIKIGDPDVLISGEQRYRIEYTVYGAMNEFEDHDELFWNVTGNDWPVTIERAEATVVVPELQGFACFQGQTGSTVPCEAQRIAPDSAGFATTAPLPPGSGLTIVLATPAGAVDVAPPILILQKTPWQEVQDFLGLTLVPIGVAILLGIAGIVLVMRLWWLEGRDRWFGDVHYLTGATSQTTRPFFARETVIVEYTPPEIGKTKRRLRPAEIGLLLDERADTLDVSATIIDLAVRGYLRIKELHKTWIFGKEDFELEKLKDADDELLTYEASLLRALFKGKKSKVKMSGLKNKFHKDLASVKKSLYTQGVKANRFFPGNPETARNTYLWAGLVIAGVGGAAIFGLGLLGFGVIGVPVVIAGLLLAAMHSMMARRTASGRELYRRSLGFREYMVTAETDRMRFAEEENIFDKYLPYAIVYGCVDKWAQAFEGLGSAPDNGVSYHHWYVGSRAFAPLAFASSINSFSSSISGAIASTPSSSGGSGFGGGGFSGGGFGGGGGGSW